MAAFYQTRRARCSRRDRERYIMEDPLSTMTRPRCDCRARDRSAKISLSPNENDRRTVDGCRNRIFRLARRREREEGVWDDLCNCRDEIHLHVSSLGRKFLSRLYADYIVSYLQVQVVCLFANLFSAWRTRRWHADLTTLLIRVFDSFIWKFFTRFRCQRKKKSGISPEFVRANWRSRSRAVIWRVSIHEE